MTVSYLSNSFIVHCPRCKGTHIRVTNANVSTGRTWIAHDLTTGKEPVTTDNGIEGIGAHLAVWFLCESCPEGFAFSASFDDASGTVTLEFQDADGEIPDESLSAIFVSQ